MVNRPKAVGTAGETAVVRVFQARGWPHAKRHALSGSKDIGDLNVHPDIVVEVKAGNAARTASDALIAKWLEETETERVNARAQIGLLVVARKGIGNANAHRWWAIMPLWTMMRLDGWEPTGRSSEELTVRMYLGEALSLLVAAGYSDNHTSV